MIVYTRLPALFEIDYIHHVVCGEGCSVSVRLSRLGLLGGDVA